MVEFSGTGPWYGNQGVAGQGTNNKAFKDTDPGAASGTSVTSVNPAAWFLFKPGTTSTVNGGTGSTPNTSAGQNFGYNFLATDFDATVGLPSQRLVVSGNVTCTVTVTFSGINTANIAHVQLFKRSSGGTLTFLGSGTSASNNSTTTTYTATVNLASPVVFAAGETLHAEVWFQPNDVVAGVVHQTVTLSKFNINANLRYSYSRAQTDSAPASDVSPVDRQVLFPRIETETLTTSDAIARALTLARENQENIATVDALLRAYFASRGISETLPIIVDLALRQVLYRRLDVESYPTAETLAVAFQGSRLIVESLSESDVAGRGFVGTRSLVETLTTSAALGRTYRANRGAVDTTSVSDVAGRQVSLVRGGIEAVPTSDIIFRQLTYVRQLGEDIGPGGSGTIIVEKKISINIFD